MSGKAEGSRWRGMKGKEMVAEEELQTTSPHRELLKLLQAVSITVFLVICLTKQYLTPRAIL